MLSSFYYCSLCRTGRTRGLRVVYVPDCDGGILSSEQPNEVIPTQETPITPKTSTQESLSDSEDLHGKLVPGVSETSFMHEFTNKPTLIGQLFKEADSSDWNSVCDVM